MSPAKEAKQLATSRAKAHRALKLWERGHDLRAIAELVGIPTGSVTSRIELGRRLRDAGL